MTTTKLESLSNEELSALVAEKVMGWETYTPKPYSGREVWWSREIGSIDYVSHWSPATSIADAWEVVEKMGSPEHEFTTFIVAGVEPNKALATMERCPSEGEYKKAEAESTAPRAICIAALRAVGWEEEG